MQTHLTAVQVTDVVCSGDALNAPLRDGENKVTEEELRAQLAGAGASPISDLGSLAAGQLISSPDWRYRCALRKLSLSLFVRRFV